MIEITPDLVVQIEGGAERLTPAQAFDLAQEMIGKAARVLMASELAKAHRRAQRAPLPPMKFAQRGDGG